MIHRALERFSALAATGVVFVYLAGLFLGTATYFVGRAVGASLDVEISIGYALALAVEVHSFLSQRLTRSHWQQRNTLDETHAEWDAADRQFRIHLGITCGLVAFSVFNSIAFWALVMHPQGFGDWLQVVVRGLVVPLAFLAAGFLTPLQHDASQLLQDAAHSMLRQTVKVTIKQWRRRVARARKAGINLAGVAVELMEDAREYDAARRISIIDRALDAAEGTATSQVAAVAPSSLPAHDALLDERIRALEARAAHLEREGQAPAWAVERRRELDALGLRDVPATEALEALRASQHLPPLETFDTPWDRPPTGGGTPSKAPGVRTPRRRAEPALKLMASRAPAHRRTASAEERVRRVLELQPDISAKALAKRARVSDSTASKYRRLWEQERDAAQLAK